MRQLRLMLSLAAALALVAAGCGGGGDESVPGDAVAVVGENTIAKTQFDGLLNQAKKSYKAQKRAFPKAGSPEYNNLKNQAILYLVQRAQFEQKAADLDIEVSDEQVEARLKQIKQQYFGGNEVRYRAQIKQQGLSDAQVRQDVRAQLVQEALFKNVTDDVKVTDKQVADFYNKSRSQYGQPETREVRHILVSSKKLADEIYERLEKGESFTKLAKQYSKDPSSKQNGGKLTAVKGQTVAPFDQTAFLLGKGTLSKPVKTQYGYHLIEPLSAVKPAKVTPLKSVKESIRQQLLQTKRNEAMTKWVEETKKEFSDDTSYQVGFAPPKPADTTAGSTASE